MFYHLKRLCCLYLLIFSTAGITATHLPRGCEVMGFSHEQNEIKLNPDGSQAFYLLQNRSAKTIQLQRHETRDVFMSPKLEANIAPDHWAAFAADEKNFYFRCLDQNTPINCSDVIDICQYPRANFALSNMGTYWVSTNKSQQAVIKEAIAKGIYLKW